MSYPVGRRVQLNIGHALIKHFDRDRMRKSPNRFFKALRNRLLDLCFGKFHKDPRRMKTSIPDSLLIGWESDILSLGFVHKHRLREQSLILQTLRNVDHHSKKTSVFIALVTAS